MPQATTTLVTGIFSIDILVLILAALSTLFTLITGGAAIAVAVALAYFKKLGIEREREVQRLVDLEQAFHTKIADAEERLTTLGSENESIEELKESYQKQLQELGKDYYNFRNRIYHLTNRPYIYKSAYERPFVKDDSVTIDALLGQIAALQEQLSNLQKDNNDRTTI